MPAAELLEYSQLPDGMKQSASSSRNTEVTGNAKRICISFLRVCMLFVLACQQYHSVRKAYRALRGLLEFRNKVFGFQSAPKLIRHRGKYYSHLYVPGFPSAIFNNYVRKGMNYIIPLKSKVNRLQSAFMAITKKCPLQCEHCFEWNELNKKETLSSDELHSIVEKLLNMGISQIYFSGGEPLSRFDDLLSLLRQVKGHADGWIYTSAFRLTAEKARQLKEAGATGVVVSLDHFIAAEHNAFRHHQQSFYWVEEGMKNANNAGLLTALSCCIRKEFLSVENLQAYVLKAKELGAAFVQLLDPKAVGHYEGKDVKLSVEEIKILEGFYFHYLSSPLYKRDFPILVYPGYHERNTSCFMAGDRSVYINTNGDIQLCPFCQTITGSMLSADAEEQLDGTDLCSATKRWKEMTTHA